MFAKNIGLAGGMAPTRKYIPELLERVLAGGIDPGIVFDLTVPLDEVAEGYRAMDERRAIKVLVAAVAASGSVAAAGGVEADAEQQPDAGEQLADEDGGLVVEEDREEDQQDPARGRAGRAAAAWAAWC